ncbi:hypothetical protein ACFX5U_17775 [Sphingobacterium sp. SG20118]|uniref:hypothetical protein n=1 Tax=Sphingobacterium TaxID=28453 RepID=UPI0004F8D263|nr:MULTISPECIES: hypothetical protein [Sphingobacterium]AIM38564.1 hypothetical protein KO02_19070 [Sphingobacterium sp. ML3W]MDH5825439.1 hypothetical protein [Sphingobacterium faecium]
MNNYIKFIALLLIFTVVLFGVHHYALPSFGIADFKSLTGFELYSLYTFESLASLVILIVILISDAVMPKNLGFIFLGLITLKAALSYVYFRAGMNHSSDDIFEYNFLVVFFLFLFFDVLVAFKVINKDVESVNK